MERTIDCGIIATKFLRKLINDNGFYVILFILFVFLLVLTIFSDGTYGGSDDYMHYSFARYAYIHPHLFLDLWAKPVYVALASPFA
jgi:hypothetical protein